MRSDDAPSLARRRRRGVSFPRPHLPRRRSTSVLAEPPSSFPFPGVAGGRGRTRRIGTSRKKRRYRDKGSACERVEFTPRHQRNCMRGNKQNYKARGPDYFSASSLPRLSPAIFLDIAASPSVLSSFPLSLSLEALFSLSCFPQRLRLPESRDARLIAISN